MAATEQTLQDLEALLSEATARREAARAELEAAQADIDGLTPAIDVVRRSLGRGRLRTDAGVAAKAFRNHLMHGQTEFDGDMAVVINGNVMRVDMKSYVNDLPLYRGKPRIPSVILRLMGDHARRDSDTIVDLINAIEPFVDDPPARASILNRLNDLVNDPDSGLVKHDDGTYQLVSPDGWPPAGEAGQQVQPGSSLSEARQLATGSESGD
jgi:hypothetical protein